MKLIDAFPEIGDVEISDDQVRGVNIAYKQFVNALGVERDPPPPPHSAGEFLAMRTILPIIGRYGTDFVDNVRNQKLLDAFRTGDTKKKQDIATAAEISLDVAIPADTEVKP